MGDPPEVDGGVSCFPGEEWDRLCSPFMFLREIYAHSVQQLDRQRGRQHISHLCDPLYDPSCAPPLPGFFVDSGRLRP